MDYMIYIGASIAELLGCFAFWGWARNGMSPLYLIPGTFFLCLFAYILTFVETEFAGRTYAIYCGIFIGASLLWMWVIEGNIPDKWDLIGTCVSIVGAIIILAGPRT